MGEMMGGLEGGMAGRLSEGLVWVLGWFGW